MYKLIFLDLWLQDAKGNFVRRWIQRQLNFGKFIIHRYLMNSGL